MKRKLLLSAALVCCFVVVIAAVIGNMSGKWTGNLKTPDGNDTQFIYILTADGSNLTGSAQAVGDPKKINDGKIDGNDLTFNITDDDGKTIIPHKGKYYAQGDSLGMSFVYENATFHLTLKRADK